MGSMSRGPWAGHHPHTPDFGAEVSYTIRKAWYTYKTRCAVLFQHVWPCILSFPGLSSEQPKTILCFMVSRNWGMTEGRDTLSKDKFLAQVLLGFL